jgi:hypothetical protein
MPFQNARWPSSSSVGGRVVRFIVATLLTS